MLRVVLWTGYYSLGWALQHRLALSAFALLETTGRWDAAPQGVANGLAGDTFWVIEAHGTPRMWVSL